MTPSFSFCMVQTYVNICGDDIIVCGSSEK